jgi:hypothetical protein
VKRILEHIGEASKPPPVSPSRAPPEEAFAFGTESGAEVDFEFNQDPPGEEEFDFDQRTEWDDESGV